MLIRVSFAVTEDMVQSVRAWRCTTYHTLPDCFIRLIGLFFTLTDMPRRPQIPQVVFHIQNRPPTCLCIHGCVFNYSRIPYFVRSAVRCVICAAVNVEVMCVVLFMPHALRYMGGWSGLTMHSVLLLSVCTHAFIYPGYS